MVRQDIEKSLILLSFLPLLLISWPGLLGIRGARDRWEMLVQGTCALGERGDDQGIPKQTSDRNHRILENLGLEGP